MLQRWISEVQGNHEEAITKSEDRVTDSVTRVDGSVVDATTGQELSGVRVQISLSGAG